MSKTTIQVDTEIKNQLENLKIHPREPYSDVIARLLQICEDSKEEYQKLVHRTQEQKMREVWDNKEDSAWDTI